MKYGGKGYEVFFVDGSTNLLVRIDGCLDYRGRGEW